MRETAVIGLGKSGVAATRLLARAGRRVYASDASDKPYAADAVAALRALPGVTVQVGGHDLARVAAAEQPRREDAGVVHDE